MPVRTNSFDGIRLLAAITVLIAHAGILTGRGPSPVILGLPLHQLPVAVFFSISGWLIAGSWIRLQSPTRYLGHRALRILPALAAVTVISVFIIGPLTTTDSVRTYFGDHLTWAYLLNLLTIAQYKLPGVFEGLPRDVVNGSLWTIGVEAACYLAVLGVGRLSNRNAWVGYAGMMLCGVSVTAVGASLEAKGISDAAPMVVLFAVSALLRTAPFARRVLRWRAAVIGLLFWIIVSLLTPEWSILGEWLAIPLLIILVGNTSVPILRSAARGGDFSYGTYLWGFPVQQVIVLLGGSRLPLVLDIILVCFVTLILAAMSWWIIEKRALSFKDGSRPFRLVTSFGAH